MIFGKKNNSLAAKRLNIVLNSGQIYCFQIIPHFVELGQHRKSDKISPIHKFRITLVP
ncbi:hypothetical protein SAMN05421747_10444 [Parapedobacter composti]|uniref:Uncharacterized protein n=1 Tax=Parapedobacter composti TaxID=623281 RepID=A0A1I1G914_9SPHI|nr:hypothetical protein SAMN05421747_10444 [Parapedobacter composti]